MVRIVLQFLFHPEMLTLNDLVDMLGVSRRTIFRDIQLLREVGFPIEYDSREGHYCLRQPQAADAVRSSAAAMASALQVANPSNDRSSCASEWPFNWQESVALFALLRSAPVPEGTEWREILNCVDAELKRRVQRAFGRKAGTISAHAGLLAYKPHLSVNSLRDSMERFWRCRMEPD